MRPITISTTTAKYERLANLFSKEEILQGALQYQIIEPNSGEAKRFNEV